MPITRQIESLFRAGTSAGLSDGQLLERFERRRDEAEAEAAFAALVDRHGPMVLRVCRQVLGDEEDARDAWQATSLVLARRAGSIGRRESIGCWLYGVAIRVAKKARVAAARRRAHERRGGGMAARRMIEETASVPERREAGAILQEELGRLPEAFRAPLVPCYLEGLTQEQAAARLGAPLGTIQSRLARGRARIRERLERRGLGDSGAILAAAFVDAPPPPPPPAWADAAVRMAMRPGGGVAVAPTAAGLAEAVGNAMALGRLATAAAMVLVALVLVSGALAWAARQGGGGSPPMPAVRPIALGPSADPPPQPDRIRRTIRGIVRDERGRPIARAWIGDHVRPLADEWRIITAPDRIREARAPHRDEAGHPVPPGPLGRYFEYRDDSGTWRAVHPGDVRRHDPSRDRSALTVPPDLGDARGLSPDGLLEVRTAKGRRQMFALMLGRPTAPRTDAEGRFSLELDFYPRISPNKELHFASPDFRREAVRVVRADGPDRPIEVTLKPVRPVRARVIEIPGDHPEIPLRCRFFSINLPDGDGGYIGAIGARGALWGFDHPGGPADGPGRGEGPRRFEARLVAGRYRAVIDTPTFHRVIDLDIPGGEGPIDWPDIRLESFAWVRMLGRPAAEIAAVDLDGNPASLADHRGRVVVLTFWASGDDRRSGPLDRLAGLRDRLKDQPLALLALHDASLTSAEAFRRAMTPVLGRWDRATGPPVRLLLDRPPDGGGADPSGLRAGERGSGRTRSIYEIPGTTTLVIDRRGRLTFALTEDGIGFGRFQPGQDGSLDHAYELDPGMDLPEPRYDAGGFAFHSLLRAVETALGLPLTPMPESRQEPAQGPPGPGTPNRVGTPPKGPLRITGTVVGIDGKPIAGATVALDLRKAPEGAAKTDADGAFALSVDSLDPEPILQVEAPGMATRTFATRLPGGSDAPPGAEDGRIIEPDGHIPSPMRMGPGADVVGRAVRDGRPVPGLAMVLHRRGLEPGEDGGAFADFLLEDMKAGTDDRGIFRFERVAAGGRQRYSVYARADHPGDLQVSSPRTFRVGPDGETIDLGDLEVRPGRTLAGRVIFADRRSPPPGAMLLVSPELSGGRIEPMDAAGRFAIHGIPDDRVAISPRRCGEGKQRPMKLSGYHLSAKNKCLDPCDPDSLRGMLDRDIGDLTILIEPGEVPHRLRISEIDPAALADFREAEAGPITGVPPGTGRD